MKRLLSIFCALITVNALADPVITPHTFTSGTPAIASQVNENFQAHAAAINANSSSLDALSANVSALSASVSNMKSFRLYRDGIRVGKILMSVNYPFGTGSTTTTNIIVNTDKNYFVKVRIGSYYWNDMNIDSQSTQILYSLPNCSGQQYIQSELSLTAVTNKNDSFFPMLLNSGLDILFTSNSQIFYTSGPIQNVALKSLMGGGSCSNQDAIEPAKAVYPNDPAVTGWVGTTDTLFTGKIVFE